MIEMRTLRASSITLSLVALASGCTIEPNDEETFEDCAIDALSGDFHYSYAQTAGECGQVKGEIRTEQVDKNPANPTNSNCNLETANVSKDRCRAGAKYACATGDGLGTQTWAIELTQTAADELQGGAILTINHPTGACQSSYDVTVAIK